MKKSTIVTETNEMMQEALKKDAQEQLLTIARDIRQTRKEMQALQKQLADYQQFYADVVAEYEAEVEALGELV